MAKRLNPIERYVKPCAWCGSPFLQKDPAVLCCCKKHSDNVRLGKVKLVIMETEDTNIPDGPAIRVQQARETLQNIRHIPDPPELSGLDLLAWRNEQRAKKNP